MFYGTHAVIEARTPEHPTLIAFDEAYAMAINAARPLPSERVPLTEALHRILAQDVTADMDMPPFDKAMVDGYACRRADLHAPLEFVETIAAGKPPTRALAVGQCAKIMTGAMVPEGADCVFMVERSEAVGDGRIRWTGEKTGDNIARTAQDMRKGDTLLRAGDRISPAAVAVLAAMGCVEPQVARRPRVAVMATGDELVEPSRTPSVSQIRNSNGYQLMAQLAEIGADARYMGIVRDDERALDEAIGRTLAEHDVVLLSGGVSMGDFDLVPGVLKKHGVRLQFDKVAIQPGKPTVFGVGEGVFTFGLPGNPVSTFVIFEILVKPFLFRMMGHDYAPPTVRMPLAETISRKFPERKAWVPAQLTPEGTVRRIAYHGSAHINALAYADGLIPFELGQETLDAGTVVEVRMLRR